MVQSLTTQLFLSLPSQMDAGFEKQLEDAVSKEAVATVMMEVETASTDLALAHTFCQLSQKNGVAFLLGVNAQNLDQGRDLLKQWDADGLHFLEPDMALKQTRQKLGTDIILGGFCGLSRHAAMLLGEGGADYIAFGYEHTSENKTGLRANSQEFDQILVFLEWYLEVFELPAVVWNCKSQENMRQLVDKGADFIDVSETVWQGHEKVSEMIGILQDSA